MITFYKISTMFINKNIFQTMKIGLKQQNYISNKTKNIYYISQTKNHNICKLN